MLKKRCIHILGLSLIVACGQALADTARPVTFRTQTMGTWGSLTLVTSDSASVADLAYRTLLAFHRVDSLFSNWTDDSEVARINRSAAPYEIEIHPDVAEVIDFALSVSRDSDGAFDITIEPLTRLWGFIGGPPRVPSSDEIDQTLDYVGYDKLQFDREARTIHFVRDRVGIDFGGIAKGYGVDEAAAILREAGVEHALIDLSGNMVGMGSSTDGNGWMVGIRDPSGAHSYLARVQLNNEAVATSGDYEQFVDDDGKRYGHILDPRSGWSAHGLTSVTVVAANAMTADAWATALFVLGPSKAREIAAQRDDLAVVLVEPQSDGLTTVWVEEQLRDRVTIPPDLEATLRVQHF